MAFLLVYPGMQWSYTRTQQATGSSESPMKVRHAVRAEPALGRRAPSGTGAASPRRNSCSLHRSDGRLLFRGVTAQPGHCGGAGKVGLSLAGQAGRQTHPQQHFLICSAALEAAHTGSPSPDWL